MISKWFIKRESTKTCVGTTTVSYFGGEEKVAKSLELFGRSTPLYIVVPFLCPFLCLTLALSLIRFGVVPFSLVVAFVSTSTS